MWKWSGVSFRIFRDSFVVFLFLNILENYLHYTIGRSSSSTAWRLQKPTWLDIVRMVIIMIVFGLLQGGLTVLVERFIDHPVSRVKSSQIRKR